jgi:hypothetical protein
MKRNYLITYDVKNDYTFKWIPHLKMIVGGGGYGVVLYEGNKATKYFYSETDCKALEYEANIQRKVRQLFLDNNLSIKIPKIYNVYNHHQKLNIFDVPVLCGIEMEYIKPLKCLDNISSQIHLAFGYNGDDIDTEWIVNSSGIPRGFYMSAELLELVLNERNSKLSIDTITSTMGKGLALLIDNNILPNDVEWIIDDNLDIWMIDFGLCRDAKISKEEYLNKTGLEGLANDIYVPKKSMLGYDSFIQEYKC